jgi:hypothetical protein
MGRSLFVFGDHIYSKSSLNGLGRTVLSLDSCGRYACNPNIQKAEIEGSWSKTDLGKSTKPYPKIKLKSIKGLRV